MQWIVNFIKTSYFIDVYVGNEANGRCHLLQNKPKLNVSDVLYMLHSNVSLHSNQYATHFHIHYHFNQAENDEKETKQELFFFL